MKIAILTMFNGLNESYSLVCSVKAQLKILLENNYSIKMLVSDNCEDSSRKGIFADEKIEWVKITNTFENAPYEWVNYEENNAQIPPSFYVMRDKIALDLEKHLADVDVCIAHDILYQGLHLVHNAGLRIALDKLPKIRVLAFTHSKPRPRPTFSLGYPLELMYKDLKNATFICPTSQDLTALSNQYGVPLTRCASLPTAFDPLEGMSEEVLKIFSKVDLSTPEFILVYPARSVSAKAHNQLLVFAGLLKRISKSDVLIICCDIGSNEQFYRLMEFTAKKNGLEEKELIFTSKVGFTQGISHKSVLDLFTLSNIVALPSVYETQSLLISEASSRGNFLVLNDDTPLFKKIASDFGATLFHFGNAGLPFANDYDYFQKALNIVESVRKNPVLTGKLASRRLYSPKKIGELLIELLNKGS